MTRQFAGALLCQSVIWVRVCSNNCDDHISQEVGSMSPGVLNASAVAVACCSGLDLRCWPFCMQIICLKLESTAT
jgi:hypothetical protein